MDKKICIFVYNENPNCTCTKSIVDRLEVETMDPPQNTIVLVLKGKHSNKLGKLGGWKSQEEKLRNLELLHPDEEDGTVSVKQDYVIDIKYVSKALEEKDKQITELQQCLAEFQTVLSTKSHLLPK